MSGPFISIDFSFSAMPWSQIISNNLELVPKPQDVGTHTKI
ncbi:hypothetical protein LEP1GSC084_0845 [Leptospira interrogans serovar Medanensis str. L0448]|nr:hypothetical protein LEP1GSC084_0845 [Leptospira interrogans serovar Medanensis str. L0448]EMN95222.1 hypothetical protein LEP1GSC110_4939 [Leptospira interrogans serovar Medanensis str. UT053]